MGGTAKFFIMLVVAFVVAWIFESDPPVNKGAEIMTILVICGMVYFFLWNKRGE